MPACGGSPCAQVGVDVRTAEGVDRLLGITDQQQAALGLCVVQRVDAGEQAILQRVGVLEFVDQRHRKLPADQLGQALAVVAVQSLVEAAEHVVEAHFRPLPLGFGKACAHPGRRVLQGLAVRAGQRLQACRQLAQRIQRRVRRWLALFPHLGQALRGEALEAGIQAQFARLTLRPVAQAIQPGLVVLGTQLAGIDLLVGHRLVEQLLQLIDPLRPGRLELGKGLLLLAQGGLQQAVQRLLRRRAGLVEQRLQRRPQAIRAAPGLHHPLQGLAVQRVAVQAPVVAHHLGEQLAVVGLQLLGEQAAAVEGMLAQHALAPTVNGRDGRLVHPLGGAVQALRAVGPGLAWIIGAQQAQQRVAGLLVAEGLRRLHQAVADTFAQLAGGGVGEGHHEDFRGQQRPGERLRAAMPEHQAQVQGGDGVGLAGAGAGFDEPAAIQRKIQGEGTGGAHGCSSRCSSITWKALPSRW